MTVYLLGAGPGDPGLITVKGAEIMKRADVVVHDRLAHFTGGVLDLAPEGAEKINVGKSPKAARFQQDEINALLIELGKKHEVVVRLKGGDPFVFARGGEEAEALIQAGISFEVIPGITSPIGVPAYAGIPVTLRHSSTSFTVITGHEDPESAEFVNWEAAAKLGGTLIILMGVARWEKISNQLLQAGLDPETPAAAIQWGTRPNQQTVRGTLATLGNHNLEAPMTIVVGAVAAKDLSWFESLPLFGKKILVTRDLQQANIFAQEIFALGGEPVVVPLIEIVGPSDGGKGLKESLARLEKDDWLVCTSANGVRYLFSLISDSRALGGLQIGAIGLATAEEFAKYNVRPDLVPKEFVAEALLEAFPEAARRGSGQNNGQNSAQGNIQDSGQNRQKVLIASAAKARDILPKGLAEKGYEVLVEEAYETKQRALSKSENKFGNKLEHKSELEMINECDVVTFASSSAVSSFAALDLGAPKLTACIGPITAATAQKAGFEPQIVASEYSTKGLLEALVAYFS